MAKQGLAIQQGLALKRTNQILRRKGYMLIFLLPPVALVMINRQTFGLDFSEKVVMNLVLVVYVYALIVMVLT